MVRYEYFRCDRCANIYTPKDKFNTNSILFANKTITPKESKPRSFNEPSLFMMIPLPSWMTQPQQDENIDNRAESQLCPKCELLLVMWFNEPFEERMLNENV